MTTARPWSCCEPLVARGARCGRYRRLYFLHGVYCPASLLRRQTVSAWVEQSHPVYEVSER
jgi:hypothetical protein